MQYESTKSDLLLLSNFINFLCLPDLRARVRTEKGGEGIGPRSLLLKCSNKRPRRRKNCESANYSDDEATTRQPFFSRRIATSSDPEIEIEIEIASADASRERTLRIHVKPMNDTAELVVFAKERGFSPLVPRSLILVYRAAVTLYRFILFSEVGTRFSTESRSFSTLHLARYVTHRSAPRRILAIPLAFRISCSRLRTCRVAHVCVSYFCGLIYIHTYIRTCYIQHIIYIHTSYICTYMCVPDI